MVIVGLKVRRYGKKSVFVVFYWHAQFIITFGDATILSWALLVIFTLDYEGKERLAIAEKVKRCNVGANIPRIFE